MKQRIMDTYEQDKETFGVSWLQPGLLATGCSKEKSEAAVPEGIVQMNFCQQVFFQVPFSDPQDRERGSAPQEAMSLSHTSRPIGDTALRFG